MQVAAYNCARQETLPPAEKTPIEAIKAAEPPDHRHLFRDNAPPIRLAFKKLRFGSRATARPSPRQVLGPQEGPRQPRSQHSASRVPVPLPTLPSRRFRPILAIPAAGPRPAAGSVDPETPIWHCAGTMENGRETTAPLATLAPRHTSVAVGVGRGAVRGGAPDGVPALANTAPPDP